jgi:hypothetical protein
MLNINKHDQKRIDDLVKSLNKAKEKARLVNLYLLDKESHRELIMDIGLVDEHITNALGHLIPEGYENG